MLPIPSDHSLYLTKIVQLQLSRVLLVKICPRGVITCTGTLQEVTAGSCAFKVCEQVQNNTFIADSSNHSLYLVKIVEIQQSWSKLRTEPASKRVPVKHVSPAFGSHTRMLSLKTPSRSRSETQSHLSTQHQAPRQRSSRASGRRQACDMERNSTSVFNALVESCYYHQDRGGWREA